MMKINFYILCNTLYLKKIETIKLNLNTKEQICHIYFFMLKSSAILNALIQSMFQFSHSLLLDINFLQI